MAHLRKAALFDLDGTLIPNTSAESTFFFYLLKNGLLPPLDVLRMATALWASGGNLHNMLRGNKRYLQGKKLSDFRRVAVKYFEPRIDTMLFPSMRSIIEEHRSRGDLLLLLTGTLDVIAHAFLHKLGLDGFRAATLETIHGRYTGRLSGILPYGIGKLEVLNDMQKQFGFDRNETVYYANSFSDRFVLNAVNEPVAVNPDKKLRLYSQKMGWKILDATK